MDLAYLGSGTKPRAMGTVDDTRKAFQDFLAPELRAMSVQMEAMSRFMDTRLESMSKEIRQIEELIDVERRLTKLESKQSQVAQ
jgi:ABC-type hemin transport system substrate-binding protein